MATVRLGRSLALPGRAKPGREHEGRGLAVHPPQKPARLLAADRVDLAGQQPEDFARDLEELGEEIRTLAATPYDTSDAYWRRVVDSRLRAGDATMACAHAAMLHTGARGYAKGHRAQRRMREAYFVGIVTPATKLGVRYQRRAKPRRCSMSCASTTASAATAISRTSRAGRAVRAQHRRAGRRARP